MFYNGKYHEFNLTDLENSQFYLIALYIFIIKKKTGVGIFIQVDSVVNKFRIVM